MPVSYRHDGTPMVPFCTATRAKKTSYTWGTADVSMPTQPTGSLARPLMYESHLSLSESLIDFVQARWSGLCNVGHLVEETVAATHSLTCCGATFVI